ncbi:MAG: cell division protein SepF [Lachnospiraceae bacterium]|nr:cell division protein SepF [Lachnospiraceae bacterium]
MAKGNLLDFFKIGNDDVDDDYDDDDDIFDDDEDDVDYRAAKQAKAEKKVRDKAVERSVLSQAPAPSPSRKPVASSSYSYSAGNSFASKKAKTNSDKLVQFDRPREVRNSYPVVPPANEVYVIKPMEFDDAQTVVDFLASGKAIVINMEGLQLDSAQRIIDFIGGAVYGMQGSLKGISGNIFIAVPNSIEVSGDLRDELLNNISSQL